MACGSLWFIVPLISVPSRGLGKLAGVLRLGRLVSGLMPCIDHASMLVVT